MTAGPADRAAARSWHQPRNAIGWLMLGAPAALLRLYDVDRLISRTLAAAALEPAHLAVWITEGER